MVRVILHNLPRRTFALILCETAFIVVAIGAAAYLRLGAFASDVVWSQSGLFKSLLMAGVFQISLYYAELYDVRVSADRSELIVRILQSLAATSLVLAAVYYWAPGLIVGRGVFAIAVVIVVPVVIGWRIAFDWLAGQVGPQERLLLVGTGPAAIRLARELHERKDLGLRIVGFVDQDPARVGLPLFNPAIIGTIDEIPEIVANHMVDRVVVSLTDARGQLPMEKLLDMKLRGVAFDHLASVYEQYTGKIAVEGLRPSWLIFSSGFRKSRVLHALKRAMDVFAAIVGLAIGLPLMAVIAVAIRLTSPGPVFYHQTRVGQGGRTFTIHKFRSMASDAEAATGAVWARPGGDDRITPAGRFLRRTRLDELPQLWNVLRGEMSLVGPRPERPEFIEQLSTEIAFYGQRHVVKPGLTGWAQVRYAYGASVTDSMEKLQFDLFYIKHMSIALDLFILLKTVQIVLLRRGA
jgi:sugar transferase (PEP-CTERM system associated)